MFASCNCCLFMETPTNGFYLGLFGDLLITCFSLSNLPESDKS